jgi:hypothetical protein
MGMLDKVRTTLSIFRDEIIKTNQPIFSSGGNSVTPQSAEFSLGKFEIILSLSQADIELIEEPKNVIALGIPLRDVKVKRFYSRDPNSTSKIEDVKIVMNSDFNKTTNKSDTHLILFRIDYPKSMFITLSRDSKNKFRLDDIYSLDSLLAYKKMGSFQFKRYLSILIDGVDVRYLQTSSY